MNNRIRTAIKVHPGEGQLVTFLMGMMLLASAGNALGGASIDALFFDRFGVASLPFWYVVLGIATFLNLLLIAGLVGQVSRAKLYLILPAVLAAILIFARLLVALNLRWSYPVLYVGKEVIAALQSVFLWGMAGALLEARQAKRLFPLFAAGGIAGTMVGSFGTPVLVGVFGAENMLLIWSLALVGTLLLSRRLIQQHPNQLASHRKPAHRSQKRRAVQGIEALFVEIGEGYRYVRQSSLLRLISLAAVLFSVCWFSLLLPFSRISTAQFPNADQLAAFFGLFQGAWNFAALVISLLLASRLFARFGVINLLLFYPLIYLSAFGVLAFITVFPLIVFFRFIQLVWGMGVAGTAWQAAFNAIPDERRDQARAFINAVPGQVGIIFSGLILIIGDQALQPQQLYWIGGVAAALCVWTLWRSRRAYAQALTQALRNGQPQVFYTEEEPFGGFQRDPMTLEALRGGLADPDPGLRKLSAEILGHQPGAQVIRALTAQLEDPDSDVRSACLAAIQEAFKRTPEERDLALAGTAACLSDPQPQVRCQALKTLRLLANGDPSTLTPVENMLNDADPSVQAQAAETLALNGQASYALDVLTGLASSPDSQTRLHAMRALCECSQIPGPEAARIHEFLARGLSDPSTVVRQAVLDGMASPPVEFHVALAKALGDRDPVLRLSAASALDRLGLPALPFIWQALDDPCLESGALLALEGMSTPLEEDELRAYIARKTVGAVGDYECWQTCLTAEDGSLGLLADGFQRRAQEQALFAMRAFGLLGDRQATAEALEGLRSHDPGQRAYALESLESLRESGLIRPLLPLWESEAGAHSPCHSPILSALDDSYAWLRACAAFAAQGSEDPEVIHKLVYLAQSDPDELVRATAAAALPGDKKMDTLSTLTTMERILFLHKVALFAALPAEDLKHVAIIGVERLFPDGEYIVHQGEMGDEMYIIISGAVRVVVDSGSEIGLRKPGEYVGEMAILSQAPRMASLVAVGDVRLLCLGQKEFAAILRQRPEISLGLIQVLSDRLREQVAVLPGEGHRLT
jgi:HEAT repeat protein